MPKTKWGISTDEPDELETFDVYDGPMPPAGVYSVVIKRLGVKENRNGDDMLNGLAEIRESKGSGKSKFNGYGFWFNQNVTDQGKPYLLQFLKALGLSWKDFTDRAILEDKDRPTNVTKIGTVKFNDGNEPEARVNTKRDTYEGDVRLAVRNWLPPKDEEDDEWDDGGEEEEGSGDGHGGPF